MKISDHFTRPEDAIYQAQRNAKSSWEMEFIDDLEERFETYGDNMFLSERQLKILERLIGD